MNQWKTGRIKNRSGSGPLTILVLISTLLETLSLICLIIPQTDGLNVALNDEDELEFVPFITFKQSLSLFDTNCTPSSVYEPRDDMKNIGMFLPRDGFVHHRRQVLSCCDKPTTTIQPYLLDAINDIIKILYNTSNLSEGINSSNIIDENILSTSLFNNKELLSNIIKGNLSEQKETNNRIDLSQDNDIVETKHHLEDTSGIGSHSSFLNNDLFFHNNNNLLKRTKRDTKETNDQNSLFESLLGFFKSFYKVFVKLNPGLSSYLGNVRDNSTNEFNKDNQILTEYVSGLSLSTIPNVLHITDEKLHMGARNICERTSNKGKSALEHGISEMRTELVSKNVRKPTKLHRHSRHNKKKKLKSNNYIRKKRRKSQNRKERFMFSKTMHKKYHNRKNIKSINQINNEKYNLSGNNKTNSIFTNRRNSEHSINLDSQASIRNNISNNLFNTFPQSTSISILKLNENNRVMNNILPELLTVNGPMRMVNNRQKESSNENEYMMENNNRQKESSNENEYMMENNNRIKSSVESRLIHKEINKPAAAFQYPKSLYQLNNMKYPFSNSSSININYTDHNNLKDEPTGLHIESYSEVPSNKMTTVNLFNNGQNYRTGNITEHKTLTREDINYRWKNVIGTTAYGDHILNS